ncbi:FAD-binding oxidoreductase [Nocardia grenadensis]|uniref:FAD-binding oxidoreductase n=1 Tax=Nocardia grenadensis TaxID=931537 RepID=UPI003D74BF7F
MAANLGKVTAEFHGQVLAPGHQDYDAARLIWKGIDRQPALIFRCADVTDVRRALEYAHDAGLPFAVAGAGHDVAGRSVPDGGIVLSTARLRQVTIDPVGKVARLGAGVQWGELAAAAVPYELATTGAASASVGVAGFSLHGGYGLLMRSCGTGCDNIIEVDMVTPDGTHRTVNQHTDPDLLWAVRGAGANFGVVTSLTLRMHTIPRVTVGVVSYPVTRARDVLRAYRQITATAPNELVTDFYYKVNLDGTRTASIGICFNGARVDAERALEALTGLGRPWRDALREASAVELHALHNTSTPYGPRYHLRSHYLDELSDEVIELILDQGERITAPLTGIFLEHLGGAIATVRPDATSFHGRDARYSFLAIAGWTEPEQDETHKVWTRELSKSLEPLSMDACYANYLDDDEDNRIASAYGPGYERLTALKQIYDPTNLLRGNRNIPPTAR